MGITRRLVFLINIMSVSYTHLDVYKRQVHGTPSGLEERIPLESLLGKIIEQYLINYEFDFGIEDNLSRSMAWSSCIKKGKVLEIQEMIQIIDQLFACEIPYKSPSGKNCFITLELDEIQRRFNF